MRNKQQRIIEITEQIATLTAELEHLLTLEASDSDNIELGSKVIINNRHKGLAGKKGTVVKITDKQYAIKLHDGSIIRRAKTNVSKTH